MQGKSFEIITAGAGLTFLSILFVSEPAAAFGSADLATTDAFKAQILGLLAVFTGLKCLKKQSGSF